MNHNRKKMQVLADVKLRRLATIEWRRDKLARRLDGLHRELCSAGNLNIQKAIKNQIEFLAQFDGF